MRILMCNHEYPPLGGDGGVIHQQIAEELARSHEVCVLTSGDRELPRREVVRGVEINRVPVLGRPFPRAAGMMSMLRFHRAAHRRGQQLIDDFRPHIINSFRAIPTGLFALHLARKNQLPHAVFVCSGDIFDPSRRLSPHRTPGLRYIVRRVLRGSDRILAPSGSVAENARRFYGIQQPISILPHGLPEPILPPVDRAELGLSDDQFVLLNVGPLIAGKANYQLVELVARITDRRVVLVLVGDGPEYKRLAALSRRLRVAERLFLPGNVDEIRKLQYLQAADVFASTSQHEGFGRMYLEAMSCGLPILTYGHGAPSDLLVNGRTGYVVPLNERARFARSLQRIAWDHVTRGEMGEYNRQLALDYTSERCARRLEAVFNELVNHQPAFSNRVASV